MHLGGASSSGRHGSTSELKMKALVEEGSNLFAEYSKDKIFCGLTFEWKKIMVVFQTKMGAWKRIRVTSRAFLRRFQEISNAKGITNAKFPQSMEYHLMYVFTAELRDKGMESHSPWSSETATTVYEKNYYIVHQCVKPLSLHLPLPVPLPLPLP